MNKQRRHKLLYELKNIKFLLEDTDHRFHYVFNKEGSAKLFLYQCLGWLDRHLEELNRDERVKNFEGGPSWFALGGPDFWDKVPQHAIYDHTGKVLLEKSSENVKMTRSECYYAMLHTPEGKYFYLTPGVELVTVDDDDSEEKRYYVCDTDVKNFTGPPWRLLAFKRLQQYKDHVKNSVDLDNLEAHREP